MALQQLIEATKQQTAKQLKNITRTMGFAVKQPNGRKTFKTVDDYFKDTMDNAVMHVLNGTFDYNSIIRKVTDEMTRSGVRSLIMIQEYPQERCCCKKSNTYRCQSGNK